MRRAIKQQRRRAAYLKRKAAASGATDLPALFAGALEAFADVRPLIVYLPGVVGGARVPDEVRAVVTRRMKSIGAAEVVFVEPASPLLA